MASHPTPETRSTERVCAMASSEVPGATTTVPTIPPSFVRATRTVRQTNPNSRLMISAESAIVFFIVRIDCVLVTPPNFLFYAGYLLLEPIWEDDAGYLPSAWLSSILRRKCAGILTEEAASPFAF